MFKNFGNVYKFSLKNALTRGYKLLTVVMCILLIAVPILIMFFSAKSKSDNKEEEIESCQAEKIYVVNELGGEESDFNSLNLIGEKNYDNITYINYSNADDALKALQNGESAFVLGFENKNGTASSYIVVPKGNISESDAENYFDFMDKYQSYFIVLAAGLDQNGLRQVMTQSEYETFHVSGYEENVSIADTEENDKVMAESVLSAMKSVLPYISLMLLYFLIISYGASIAQSIVMEKSSKLMDTMLVSVRPEALCLGKFLAVVTAGVLQILLWIASVVVGFIIGNMICTKVYPDANFALLAFFKAMNSLNVFSLGNVIIALLILIIGFLLFASLAVVAGAISGSREEAASASAIFIIPLIISFFAIMYGGGLESGGAPAWMLYVPFTAALITPSYVALGACEFLEGMISLGIIVTTTLIFIIVAGRLYKMMSLYKGNGVKLGKALKMLFTGNSAAAKK